LTANTHIFIFTLLVPVIAIVTKFDDLVVQVYSRAKNFEESYKIAGKLLDDNLEAPLLKKKVPPKQFVRLEGMLSTWLV